MERSPAIPVLGLLALVSACGSAPVPPALRAEAVPVGGGRGPLGSEGTRLAEIDRLMAEERYESAEAMLRSLIAGSPNLARAHQRLGRCLLETLEGDPLPIEGLEEAETHLLMAIRLQERDSESHWDLGRLYEKEGHLEAALGSFKEALQHNVNFKPALLSAARLSTRLGEEREAVRHLEALRALPPVAPEVVVLEARVYQTLGEAVDQGPANQKEFLQRALAAYSELRERFPENAAGPAGQAWCLMRQIEKGFVPMDREGLTALWLEAARLDPKDPEPVFALAAFLEGEKAQDRKAAIETYRRALERDREHLPTLLNLASALWDEDRKEEARGYYRRALPRLQDPREKEQVEERLELGKDAAPERRGRAAAESEGNRPETSR